MKPNTINTKDNTNYIIFIIITLTCFLAIITMCIQMFRNIRLPEEITEYLYKEPRTDATAIAATAEDYENLDLTYPLYINVNNIVNGYIYGNISHVDMISRKQKTYAKPGKTIISNDGVKYYVISLTKAAAMIDDTGNLSDDELKIELSNVTSNIDIVLSRLEDDKLFALGDLTEDGYPVKTIFHDAMLKISLNDLEYAFHINDDADITLLAFDDCKYKNVSMTGEELKAQRFPSNTTGNKNCLFKITDLYGKIELDEQFNLTGFNQISEL